MTTTPVKIQTLDGSAREIPAGEIETLARSLTGEITLAGDAGYDETRSVWNGMIDRRPALVATCRCADDVAAAVRFAADRRLLTTVRGGGHNVAGTSIADDSFLVDLGEMRAVDVDPTTDRVRVEAGARLGDLDAATQPHGLAVPVGVVSATGVAGLTMHGGLGWLTRHHGLSLDNLVAVDLVTADGEPRRATVDENSDLFWAVRGAGPNFGVVTSFEFAAHAVGPDVWFAAVFYPEDAIGNVLDFFRSYMPTAPAEIGALAVYWTAPAEDFIPVEAQGQPAIVVLACHSGPLDEGEEALGPFRTIAAPLADLTEVMPFTAVQQFLDEDYPDGGHYYWKSLYVADLSDDVLAILADHHRRRPSPESSVDVWALQGPAQEVEPTATAFAQRAAPYLIGIEANWHDSANDDANVGWARDLYAALEPFASQGTYLNFPGFAEEGDAQLRAAYGPNYDRLRFLKSTWDPMNLFRGNLNIPPA